MTVVNLNYPIMAYGAEVSTLEFKRPKVADIVASEKASQNQLEQVRVLIARLCSIPETSVDQIDAADFQKLGEVIKDFLEPSPKIGGE